MKLCYKKVEERYLKGLNKGRIAVWEWDIEKDKFYFSKNLENIVQKKLENTKSLFDFINKIKVEENKMDPINELESLLDGASDLYKKEFKIQNENGEEIWILIEGDLIKNHENKIKLLAGYIEDITDKKKLKDDIEYLYYYDSLTKLPNRALFKENFKLYLNRWKLKNQKGSIIYMDINDFKLINDIYGPSYGDLVLKEVSRILCESIYGSGKIHRLSADEFIILVENFHEVEDINKLCKRILERLKLPLKIKEKDLYITVSFGISLFPKDGTSMLELYRYSDLALAQSKMKGKNFITFFEKSMSNKYDRKFLIEQELKSAISNDELYIMYQPQVNSFNNKTTGFEALLRWRSNELGLIAPSEFIPIAESSGSIVEIGEWVIDNVCKQINLLNKLGYSFENISINISPMQLNKDFIDKLIDICQKNNTSPSLIEIEITEGMLIDLHNNKIEILNEIIKRGIKIAVDDFGKGYSSLTYLTALPINTLKIDKSFIDNIHINKYKAVVKCIIDLCKSLEYRIVAEGVEEKKQLDILNELGCNVIQGYYYSKPLFEHEMEGFNLDGIAK